MKNCFRLTQSITKKKKVCIMNWKDEYAITYLIICKLKQFFIPFEGSIRIG